MYRQDINSGYQFDERNSPSVHSKHSKIVHNKIEVAIYRLNVLP